MLHPHTKVDNREKESQATEINLRDRIAMLTRTHRRAYGLLRRRDCACRKRDANERRPTAYAKACLACPGARPVLSGARLGKFTGLSLSTPYPDQTVQAGETTVIPLTVHNYGLGPQVVSLEVLRVAKGWHARFKGDARRVGAVFVGPGADRPVSLHLIPPEDLASGTFDFVLRAQGDGHAAELPVTLHLAKTLPNWLSLTAALPTPGPSCRSRWSSPARRSSRSARRPGCSRARPRSAGPPPWRSSCTTAAARRRTTSG
jgi:hypothetical protein